MRETSKSRPLRDRYNDWQYLTGNGIDIGAGPDPLVVPNGTVRPWDILDGDACKMEGVEDESFDFVHSSHCLEHLVSVPFALKSWARILKPGGYMAFAVPHYVLYEHLKFPSQWNGDHKQTFCTYLTREMVGRPTHYHIENDLYPALEAAGMTPIFHRLEIDGYRFDLGAVDQTMGDALTQIFVVSKKQQ